MKNKPIKTKAPAPPPNESKTDKLRRNPVTALAKGFLNWRAAP